MEINLNDYSFDSKLSEEFVNAGFKQHTAMKGYSFSYEGKHCRFNILKYRDYINNVLEISLDRILHAPKEYISLTGNVLSVHADKIRDHIIEHNINHSQRNRDKNALKFKFSMLKILLQDAFEGLNYTFDINDKKFIVSFVLSEKNSKQITRYANFNLVADLNYEQLVDVDYDDYRFKFGLHSYKIPEIKPKVLELITAYNEVCDELIDLEKSMAWIQSEIDEYVRKKKLEMISINNQIQDKAKKFNDNRNKR